MLILNTTLLSFAHAGVSLQFEHPRYPSHETDHYSIKCESSCEIEVKSKQPLEGRSHSMHFQTKIKELLNLHAQGFLPNELPGIPQKVLYKIEAQDGDKKFNLLLGYPKSYTGEQFTKYTQIISIIEDVKRSIISELQEKK